MRGCVDADPRANWIANRSGLKLASLGLFECAEVRVEDCLDVLEAVASEIAI
jgi:hypothetical protein